MKKPLVKSHSLSSKFKEYFPLHSDEDEEGKEDEVLDFYASTNKLIEKEIEALKYNLKEAEQDIETLKSNNVKKSKIGLKDPEDDDSDNNPNDKIQKYSSNKDNIGQEMPQDDNEDLKRHLKALSRDIMYTKKEMLCIKEEEEYYKNQIDILNEVFSYLLEPKLKSRTDDCKKLIDLEAVFTDSLKHFNELNLEQSTLSKSGTFGRKQRQNKALVRSRQRFSIPGSHSQGLFSVEQVERILKTLKREKKYLDETNLQVWSKFLEKLLIELLQKFHDKSLYTQNQEKKRKALTQRIRYLEKFCLSDKTKDDVINESRTNPNVLIPHLIRPKESSNYDEDVKIDFEQPISLINPNYIPPSDQI